MIWLYLASFLGGAFLIDGIPYFINGVLGRKAPTPFSKSLSKGESSAMVNVLWGALNFLISYLLLCKVVFFEIHSLSEFLTAGAGGLIMALLLAKSFGRQGSLFSPVT